MVVVTEVTDLNTYPLRRWFKARFGRLPSHDRVYYEEWKARFLNGSALDRMDSLSLAKWRELFGQLDPFSSTEVWRD